MMMPQTQGAASTPRLLLLAALLVALHLDCHPSLAAVSALPPPSPPRAPLDYYDRLVSGSSSRYGRQHKQGVLPLWKYSLHFNDTAFLHFLWRSSSGQPQKASSGGAGGMTDLPTTAPMSWKCGVYVNHAYRVLLLRNRKAASSTVISALGSLPYCKGLKLEARYPNASSGSCFQFWYPEEAAAGGSDPDGVWSKYLVVTTSRNPWARAASAYEYILEQWQRHDAGCQPPPFLEYVRDPYILGKRSNAFNCAPQRYKNTDHWHHDYYHVEPAHHCFMDEEGRNVADFIVRFEHLEEDMAQLVELINARLPAGSGVPPLEAQPYLGWEKPGPEARSGAADAAPAAAPYMHAASYRRCGWACVDGVQRFAAKDMQFFGWSQVGPPPGQAAATAAAPRRRG